MRNMKKAVALVLCVILTVSVLSISALAADANVTYDGSAGKFIFAPGSDYSLTDLFPNFKDVMPGDKLTQRITLTNDASDEVKVKINLRSLGETAGSDPDFLHQLKLTAQTVNESPMFEANADETSGLTDWVCLGTLYGETVDIIVELEVPTTLDNNFQEQVGKIRWQFGAEELPVDNPSWICPGGKNHPYHIEERNGISVFVCDVCGRTKPMRCAICGGFMHEVMVITIDGKAYTVFQDGDRHYKSKDGRAQFYFNEEGILDYYTIDGERTEVYDVGEYSLYTYYECLTEDWHDAMWYPIIPAIIHHHTDPHEKETCFPETISPKTGDVFNQQLWIMVLLFSAGGTVLTAWGIARNTKKKRVEE